MREFVLSLMILGVFVLGIVAGGLWVQISEYNNQHPGDPISKEQALATLAGINPERNSPFDHIKENNIEVYKDRVVLKIDNPQWAKFTDTNSMDPVLDVESNAIEIFPESPEQINVGDIISWENYKTGGNIIHRVIEIGSDDQGWYARTKGDNNPTADPQKIRFEQVRRLVVAIVY